MIDGWVRLARLMPVPLALSMVPSELAGTRMFAVKAGPPGDTP
jgi:hypothetical protein